MLTPYLIGVVCLGVYMAICMWLQNRDEQVSGIEMFATATFVALWPVAIPATFLLLLGVVGSLLWTERQAARRLEAELCASCDDCSTDS